MKSGLTVFRDANELFDAAARIFVESAERAIEKRGQFTVALAGGSTPRGLYSLLASDDYRKKIDWTRVFFFFGDERFVSADDDDSNFRMANETLFEPIGIDPSNIVRWRTEIGDPDAAADDYADQLNRFYDGCFPVFDLALLGLGEDGHTASLFPQSAALSETEKTAVANFVPSLGVWRLTMTFPVLEAARRVVFLVSGTSKRSVLEEVRSGDPDPGRLPAQRLRDRANVVFLTDTAAV